MAKVVFVDFHREHWERNFLALNAIPGVPDDFRMLLLRLVDEIRKSKKLKEKADD